MKTTGRQNSRVIPCLCEVQTVLQRSPKQSWGGNLFWAWHLSEMGTGERMGTGEEVSWVKRWAGVVGGGIILHLIFGQWSQSYRSF